MRHLAQTINQVILETLFRGNGSRCLLPFVVKVGPRHGCAGGVADGEPGLRAVNLVEVIRRIWAAIFVATHPGSTEFESTCGQRRATAKVNVVTSSLLSA